MVYTLTRNARVREQTVPRSQLILANVIGKLIEHVIEYCLNTINNLVHLDAGASRLCDIAQAWMVVSIEVFKDYATR